MRTLLLTLLWTFIISSHGLAGWYQVENFEGFIGGQPVHFSIQKYDGFGSGITVQGSYYYTSERIPVPLYGTITGDAVRLCEIENDQKFQSVLIVGSKAPVDTARCPISLRLEVTGASGTWNDGDTSRVIKLKKVATLDDTSSLMITGVFEVPFWAHTTEQMFLGVYEKKTSGICMTALKVINKTIGKVDQLIAFPHEPCEAGMVMTSIYLNVEKFVEGGSERISVNFRDGRMGYSQSYIFDPRARVFNPSNVSEQ